MIASILAHAASHYAGSTAFEEAGQSVTYRDFAERVARLSALLSTFGIGPGERVAILAENSVALAEWYFAAAHGGFVLVPLNFRSHPEGLARVVAHSGAKLLVATDRFAALAAATRAALECVAPGAAPPHLLRLDRLFEQTRDATPPRPSVDVAPDAPAHLYYTSGTTGDPKGVVLTHRNVASHALLAIAALGLRESDVWGHIAPMFHLADAWATFAITWVGGRHVMVPDFDPPRVLDVLAGAVTMTNLVPTMLTDLVHHPEASSRTYPQLRRLLSGGAPIAPALVAKVMTTFGCEYVQTYGLTETSPYLTMSLLPARLAALPAAEQFRYRCKTGRPLAGVEVRVVRDDGTPVAADAKEVGEITCRGDTVTPGYWQNPAATAAAFRAGWFLTGDLAVVDGDGFLHIVDRKKDVIKSGGESVFSTEVEQVLYAHPGVKEAAVIGLPHARWGEAVVAVVVRRAADAAVTATPLDASELLRHCRAHLGGPQIPKAVVFQDALPRTGSGKLAKRLLRDALRTLELP